MLPGSSEALSQLWDDPLGVSRKAGAANVSWQEVNSAAYKSGV